MAKFEVEEALFKSNGNGRQHNSNRIYVGCYADKIASPQAFAEIQKFSGNCEVNGHNKQAVLLQYIGAYNKTFGHK
jgi:hypothetical protein